MARTPIIVTTRYPTSDEVAKIMGLSEKDKREVYAAVDRIMAEEFGLPRRDRRVPRPKRKISVRKPAYKYVPSRG